jgi:uncharacterized protein (TIGR00255 family)
MIRSMTGFGEAQRDLAVGHLRVTVKTVNHRHFNAHFRTPHGFDRFEAEMVTWLKGFFARGHINVSITLERETNQQEGGFPELDMERARHVAALLRTLKEDLRLQGPVQLEAILKVGDVLRVPEARGRDLELESNELRDVLEEAARSALEMREREGQRLEEDLKRGLSVMEEKLTSMEARAPERLVVEKERLQAAIRELSEQDEVDEDRIAREIAYMADRWDINEELVRFRAHIQAFREALEVGDQGPVGKRLGFLVQEMHREANTVASKANDLDIGHASVSVREEIERLREQLENVE